MKLYKLTDQNCETMNHTKWGEGVTHTAGGAGDLCGPGWLHAYEDPILAVLLNPVHANIADPILWEAEGSGDVRRDGRLKIGVTSLTTVRRIDLPTVTTDQRVEFAIRCALEVCTDPQWRAWAMCWLDGTDRSAEAARAARAAAEAAAWAAVWAARESAWLAVEAAAWAAAWAARAAETAATAAAATATAARAARAARAAAASPLDLAAIAHRVIC
jgi:hypothetical protein